MGGRAVTNLLVEDSEFVHVKMMKTSWTILKSRHEKHPQMQSYPKKKMDTNIYSNQCYH